MQLELLEAMNSQVQVQGLREEDVKALTPAVEPKIIMMDLRKTIQCNFNSQNKLI